MTVPPTIAKDSVPAGFRGVTSAATRSLLLAIGALGVSCVATQLVLMREMLCVFAGNELVLGIVLGNWLFLMGAGAWLGRWAGRLKDRLGSYLWFQIWIAVAPIAQLLAVRSLRLVVFPPDAAIGVHGTVISSFVILLPYCVPAGFLLTLACGVLPEKIGETGAGQVYVADSIGSILGGVLASLLLLWLAESSVVLVVAGLLNLTFASAIAWKNGRRWMLVAAGGAGLLWYLPMFHWGADRVDLELLHASETVLFHGNSPYGQLVITSGNHQTNFIQNGLPVLSTHNTEQVEEAVHYAMAQRPEAQRVLLIGGGVAGTAKELLKYRAEVTYVELDPLFLELGRRFSPQNLDDPRIGIVNTDGRRFVQRTPEHFDAIIVDLADPITAQLNRFHTAEFFAEARRALAAKGVLALAAGRYENYVSPELARVLATAQRTLRSVFTNVVMVPGGRVFFLASDGALGLDIAERLARAQISTRFVNRHYLDGMLTPDRLADLERAVAQPAALNRDFNPVLYFHCLRHWASQFESRAGVVWIALGLALLAYVVRLRGAAAAVFAGGFAAASLEVVLLLGFQALCGSLYYQLGIIVTVFMAGLAAGAAWANRRDATNSERQNHRNRSAEFIPLQPPTLHEPGTVPAATGSRGVKPNELRAPDSSSCSTTLTDGSAESVSASNRSASIASRRLSSRGVLISLALGVALFAVLLPLALKGLSQARLAVSSDLPIQAGIGWLTFALAALVGAQFPVANRVAGSSLSAAASRIYTADFIGASVGALLASAWLIPVLGVTMMCWLAAGLNLLGAAAVWLRRANQM